MEEKEFEETMLRATQYAQEDNYLKAFEEYSKCWKVFPQDPDLINILLFLFNRIVEANYDFEPETAEQYMFRGISKLYKDEMRASIADYDKAIALNPKFHYAIKSKAFSYMMLGEYSTAIPIMEEAIRIHARGEYFDDLAEIYSRMGDMDKVLFYHEQAVKHSPEDARLWYNYGVHLCQMGMYEKGIALFDEAIRLYPQYEDALHNKKHYSNKLKS